MCIYNEETKRKYNPLLTIHTIRGKVNIINLNKKHHESEQNEQ